MFNLGDKVICVEGKKLSNYRKDLEEGFVYTIESLWRGEEERVYVSLKEFPELSLYADRFKLAEEGYTPIIAKIRQMYLRQQLRK